MEKYSKLSLTSKKRLSSMLEKIRKAGTTLAKAKRMNENDFRTLLGSKAKSMTSQRGLLYQITKTKERREGTIQLALEKYEKLGYTSTELDKIKKELTITSGNTFFSLAQDLQDKRGLSEKESWKRTRELLALPKKDYAILEQQERELLEDYDY